MWQNLFHEKDRISDYIYNFVSDIKVLYLEMDILKRFLHARNEYDKKHQSVDRDIDDRPDSDHTVLFPPISRSAIQRLHEQGQTRTLADIAMALNEQHPFSSYEEFEQSFSAVVSGYMKRGTVSAAACETSSSNEGTN